MIDEHTTRALRAWHPMPCVPALGSATVHVWRVRIGAAAPELTGLSAEEQQRAARLAEPARTRFLSARSALRTRLAGYLGCAPDTVDFSYGETGKPLLRSHRDLHFSVAHSADIALLAFARTTPVGVDLERLRSVPRYLRIAPRVLAAPSAAALARLPLDEREDAFIWAWTQREAFVKAIGGGVLRSPDPLPFVWPPRNYVSGEWAIAPLAVDARHHACLAVGAARCSIELYDHV